MEDNTNNTGTGMDRLLLPWEGTEVTHHTLAMEGILLNRGTGGIRPSKGMEGILPQREGIMDSRVTDIITASRVGAGQGRA